jgi:hypothetical protein
MELALLVSFALLDLRQLNKMHALLDFIALPMPAFRHLALLDRFVLALVSV